VLDEAVSLVADRLQQAQRRIAPRQAKRFAAAVYEDFLLPLGQRNQHRRVELQLVERAAGRRELALSSVDEDHIRKQLLVHSRVLVATPHHFAHGREVVPTAGRLDSVASVSPLERSPVDETHHRPACLASGKVRYVDALDRSRRRIESEQLGQAAQTLGGVSEEYLRLDVIAHQAALLQAFQRA